MPPETYWTQTQPSTKATMNYRITAGELAMLPLDLLATEVEFDSRGGTVTLFTRDAAFLETIVRNAVDSKDAFEIRTQSTRDQITWSR